MLKILTKFDNDITQRIKIEPQEGLLFRIAALFAHSGDSWIWCGILFILWIFAGGEKELNLAYWGGSIFITAIIVFILKRIIARSRPKGDWGNVYRKTDPYSFPSGHAVRGGLILILAAYTFRQPWIIILFGIWALLMVLSRVATGVHFFGDVAAGFLLGLLIGWAWILLKPFITQNFSVLFDKSVWFK